MLFFRVVFRIFLGRFLFMCLVWGNLWICLVVIWVLFIRFFWVVLRIFLDCLMILFWEVVEIGGFVI